MAGSVTAKQLGPNDFEMSRAELQRIVQSVDTYARSGIKLARLVPSLAKDGREGVRVFGIGPNANCGLVLGDLVLAIDGVRVNDSALEQKRDELPGAKRVVLQLERHGEPLSLTYHIR